MNNRVRGKEPARVFPQGGKIMESKFVAMPVNLTEADNDLVLHAAMPGAEPENISITFAEDTLSLRSTMRGDRRAIKRH